MASLKNVGRPASLLCALVLGSIVAACGGDGRVDPILGTPGIGVAPMVISTSPAAATPPVAGVAINARVSAAFSKDIDPASVARSSFTLACPAGAPMLADVSYDAATRVATLIPAAALPASTVCVATLTTAIRDTSGFGLAADFTWSFVTAVAADTTPPTVVLTVPAANATAVPINTAITATFSEDMSPTTITGTSFTVVDATLGTAVAGSVAYSAAGRTAIFTPTTPATLANNTRFTATVTTAATDLAGNPLAANYVWSFTTAALPDTTAPTVTLAVPAPNATTVANNTAITATFSEDMNPTTISGTTFTLFDSTLGAAVAGVVSYSATSRTAIFTPSTPATLAANGRFTATVTTGATDLAGNALAASFVWTFTTAALPDTTPPTVTLAVPAPGATGVPNNTAITATFSKDMNPATISGTTFTLVNSTLGVPVLGSVSYSATSRTAIFTPTLPATLAPNSRFTATVTTGAADLAGNGLAANFVWTFTTAALADTTPPTVTLTVPAPGATGVPNNTAITATFSEDMNPATISGTTFRLVNSTLGTPVLGNVSYSATSRTAIFTPTTPATLAANSQFSATVTTGASDLAGNGLAANFVWTFGTAALPDTTRPTVTLTVPAPGATAVPNNTAITATFSEDMNPATISGTTFTLVNSTLGTPVLGNVSYSATSRTAIFTPTLPSTLAANNQFTATVTTGAADLAGNGLAANFVWSFTTAALADTTRPTVTLTVPAPGATAVPNNTAITATFSEDMNPATISGTTFTLVNATLGTAVLGNVSYSATSRTAIFTPSTPSTLAANSQFTATVTTGAADLAGNGLAANFVWTFTTAALPDTTRPTVTVTVPAAGATAVADNTAITATFSEDMNPATISGATFTLFNSTLGTAVAGNVSYSATSRSAIFTPTTPTTLADNNQFTATVTTGAADLAGNGLAANFVWTFTTAALPDTTRPTVTLTVPAPAATGVANNTAVTATFSEAMNPATLSATSFTVVNTTLGTPVGGTVTYSVAARTATFVPTAGVLASSSLFTATVSNAATDLAGNALAGNTAVLPGSGNHVWTFTTAALPDTIAPTVTAISPQDGSIAVCLNRTVSATFSEPMDAATIGPLSFIVSAAGVPVAGTVLYDAPSRVASFTPTALAGFTATTVFVVTVKGGAAGVKDLAGNPLAVDRVWGFTTGTQACVAPIDLRSVATFGGFGGAAGMTNQGANTVVGGNIGSTAVCTAITGFHDSTDLYTETPLNVGAVNGTVYCAPPPPGTVTRLGIAAQAGADAQIAYDAMRALPPGGDPGAGQLGGRTLPAAVYTAAGGAFVLTIGDLTLDGQGDPNAVWVFQMTAALTIGTATTPGRVLLINGAQAKNVFWQVGSAARIENRSVMVGTIIAPAGLTISTAGELQQTTLTGRAISLTASVTMVNTTIVAP